MDPNYDVHIHDFGDVELQSIQDFDFTMVLPKKVESTHASCGCTQLSCTLVGRHTSQKESYPVYRIKGSLNVGYPSIFKRPEAPEFKVFTKSITIFFNRETEGEPQKHKIIKLKYKIFKPIPDEEKNATD